MSHKLSAKNLSYDASLPPFLARLRGQHAPGNGYADGPDPILAAQRRPVKPRSASAEAEDAPLIVDDAGNIVEGLSVGADGAVKGEESAVAEDKQDDLDGRGKEGAKDQEKNGEVAPVQKIAGIGAGKKRKMGKVVGQDERNDEGRERVRAKEDKDDNDSRPTKQPKRSEGTATTKKTGKSGPNDNGKTGGKAKKKAKIQLSFGDDEG